MTEDRLNPESWIEFQAIEVIQPIGKFYVGILDAVQVTRITYADVRRIEGEPRQVETYLGIERPLNSKRVAELRDYVTTIDASFPSSVIVAVSSQDAEYEAETRILRIKNDERVAKVLDGQHRIAGLEGFEEGTFQLIVTIFVDMDIEEQALVFATINLEQTRVNKSLVYDLYEYAKQRSPQKTAHNIARLMDSEPGSPLLGKIKILGTANDRGETISQALFVESLLPMMSGEPGKDRDRLKRRQSLPRASGSEQLVRPFRNMFIDGRDAEIAQVLWNYFDAVSEKWGRYWTDAIQGSVLNRTTGFKALMRFLMPAYLKITQPPGIPGKADFATLFAPVRLEGRDFTPENYPPGTSGQGLLYSHLMSQAGLS